MLPQFTDDLEARARVYAKEILVNMIEQPIRHFGRDIYGLTPDAGSEFVVAFSKLVAASNTHGIRMVIEAARQGLQEADAALRELAVEMIDRGEPIPVFLQVYLADSHILPTTRKKCGPKRQTKFVRDMNILVLIVLVSEKFALNPTRAFGLTTKPCGCSIVADVLSEARMGGSIEGSAPTEQAVAAIWKRYSQIAFPNGLLRRA